jgi:hypothetical protein
MAGLSKQDAVLCKRDMAINMFGLPKLPNMSHSLAKRMQLLGLKGIDVGHDGTDRPPRRTDQYGNDESARFSRPAVFGKPLPTFGRDAPQREIFNKIKSDDGFGYGTSSRKTMPSGVAPRAARSSDGFRGRR